MIETLIKKDLNLDLPLFVEPIIKIIKLSIATTYLKNNLGINEPAGSILLVAGIGKGKSTVLNYFTNIISCEKIQVQNEFSYCNMMQIISEAYESKNPRPIIVTSDLGQELKMRKSMVERVRGIMLYCTDKYGLSTLRTSEGKIITVFDPPIHLYWITAIIKDLLEQFYYDWYLDGFLDRMIVISFNLSDKEIEKLKEQLYKKNSHNNIIEEQKRLMLEIEEKEVFIEEKLSMQLNGIAENITFDMNKKYESMKYSYGKKKVKGSPRQKKDESKEEFKIRCQEVQRINQLISLDREKNLEKNKPSPLRVLSKLISLVKANALLEGRTECTQIDINEIFRLSRYMNLDSNYLPEVEYNIEEDKTLKIMKQEIIEPILSEEEVKVKQQEIEQNEILESYSLELQKYIKENSLENLKDTEKCNNLSNKIFGDNNLDVELKKKFLTELKHTEWLIYFN